MYVCTYVKVYIYICTHTCVVGVCVCVYIDRQIDR